MRPDIAVPQRADVEILRAAFDSGRAITRDEVWSRYRINDRRFRAAVSALRLSGMPIVSESAAGSAYRIARTRSELAQFVGELRARARSLEAQIRALEAQEYAYFSSGEQLALIST